MSKRVFIVHGWGGSPNNDWIPWAKRGLEQRGYEVFVPEMSNTDNPKIKPWVDKLTNEVGEPLESDILIGHSIGCQTIWRFLEKLQGGKKIDKVILVAPWFELTNLEDEEKPIAKPWAETSVDFKKVKTKANSFAAIFSNNDPMVPFQTNKKIIKEKLDPKIVLLRNREHFNESTLPEILDLL